MLGGAPLGVPRVPRRAAGFIDVEKEVIQLGHLVPRHSVEGDWVVDQRLPRRLPRQRLACARAVVLAWQDARRHPVPLLQTAHNLDGDVYACALAAARARGLAFRLVTSPLVTPSLVNPGAGTRRSGTRRSEGRPPVGRRAVTRRLL